MSSSFFKNDREWWAKEKIEELTEKLVHAQRKVEVGEIEKIIKNFRPQWFQTANHKITKVEDDKAQGQVNYEEFIKSEDYQKLAQAIYNYVNKDYLQAREEKE